MVIPGGMLHLASYYKSVLSRDSAVVIATRKGWTVRGSNLGGSEIFRTRPECPWGLSSLLHNGYQDFLGGQAAGAWRSPPPFSAARRLKKEHRYTSTPPLGLRSLF